MKNLLSVLTCVAIQSAAQNFPELSTWKVNTTATGYAGIVSNVQQVQYASSNVYISCTSIPSYTIGPWPSNPNVATNQNFVFKITRNPQQNTGTPVAIGLGHTGVWSNGVSIYNAYDGMTYNNQGVWQRNAYFWEGISFDNCLGHPAQNGEYHHHVSPKCLYDINDSTNHSPIIGYAFDGFPIYGAYSYSNSNGTGPIQRMRTSYRLRNITVRNTLPNGNAAPSNGPPINSTYPLGAYLQDYEYVASLGDLDARNGRFCVTPDYPNGTYAYFVTIDKTVSPEYPYTMIGTYYGTVQAGNTGPGSGHNTISEPVSTFITSVSEYDDELNFQIFPNPTSYYTIVRMEGGPYENTDMEIIDLTGRIVKKYSFIQPSHVLTLELSDLQSGVYALKMQNGQSAKTKRLLVER